MKCVARQLICVLLTLTHIGCGTVRGPCVDQNEDELPN